MFVYILYTYKTLTAVDITAFEGLNYKNQQILNNTIELMHVLLCSLQYNIFRFLDNMWPYS